jgi:pimeloyl-ACP methyl ester carboxylesterase
MTRHTPASETLTPRHSRTTSTDGTTVGWLSVGDGPGLVVVHGTMQSARSQLHLARLLAHTHQVHLVDRRGRGLSGPYPPSARYTPVEVDDLAAVLAATGARDVLGISSGALIALRAALSVPNIARVAAFEPPLILNDPTRLALVARFHREMEAGDLPNAMTTAMLAAEMGPALLLKLPRPILRSMTRRMLSANRRPAGQPDEPSIRDLAAALPADIAVVTDNADRLDDFTAIQTPVLLLDGTRTRPYLRNAIQALERVIPGSRRTTLHGTNHGATQNSDQWGKPERVAPALLDFFA